MESPVLRRIGLVFTLGCLMSAPAYARSITIAWNPNPEPDIAGYTVYGGSACGTYTEQVQVGNQTTFTSSAVPDTGSYCFVVQAYNTSGAVSPLSDPLIVDAVITVPSPELVVEKTQLNFAASRKGNSMSSKTSGQKDAILKTPTASSVWTAQSNASWVAVKPGKGTGPGSFSVSILNGAPLDGAVATVTVNSDGHSVPVTVAFNTSSTTTSAPYGSLDSPSGTTAALTDATAKPSGITGSLAVGGWALDDVEVTRVAITRDAVPPEAAGAQIFIGDAVFVDGARPDVLKMFVNAPLNSRAGWGLMVLTNMLPNQGNGQFTLHAIAYDGDGNATELGSRTITCTNATATLPFGTIDTPAQGETIGGSSYANFGWALTPLPNSIPIDGSTIMAYVDGRRLGNVAYNNYRSDVASLFPGLANTNGAIGYRVIDTTTLANGLHTIAWTVADNAGNSSGIGSRYFNVQNGGIASDSAAVAGAVAAPTERIRADADVTFRVGFDETVPLQPAVRSTDGWLVEVDPASRLELHLPSAGYHAAAALPTGAQLDAATGVFYWHPGPAFTGAYDLAFVDRAQRANVRVVVQPAADPLVVIDLPVADAHGNRFFVAGWALDRTARVDSGILTVHVWAYKDSGEPPIFLGVAQLGSRRPDVAAVYGPQAANAGYGLEAALSEPGGYTIAVFPFITAAGRFGAAQTVHVVVP